jgi:F0F1-type ATP synthase membrane subunit c/vacuolar-type H+-ATPase subunit K
MIIKKFIYLFDAWLTGRNFTEDEFLKGKLSQRMRKQPILEGEAPWVYSVKKGELVREDNPNFINEINPEDVVFRLEKGDKLAEVNLKKAMRTAIEIDSADRRLRELHELDTQLKDSYRELQASMPHFGHLRRDIMLGIICCILLSIGEVSFITATLCDYVFGVDVTSIWRQPKYLVIAAFLSAMGIFALQLAMAGKLIERRPS